MKIKDLKNYSNWNITVKAAFWFVVTSMIQKAFSFITVPIFTRIMSTEQYGIYSTYLSWTSILMVITTLNLDSGAYSNVLGKTESVDEVNKVTTSYMTLSFLLSTIVGIVFVLFIEPISRFSDMSKALLGLMVIEMYTVPAARFWNFQQRFNYKYKSLIIYTVISSLANLILGVTMVTQAPQDEQAVCRIISIVFVQLVISMVFYVYFTKKSGLLVSVFKWKETLRFQLPLIPHFFAMNFLLSADRIMIKKLVGSAEAGIYSVAYSTGQIMTIFKMCVIDAMRPWIYDKLNKKEYSSISKIASILMILVTVISFAFSALAPEVIKVMASSDYYAAIYVIPPVALSSLFTFVYQLFVIIETYYEKSTNIMTASVVAAVLNVVLNYIFIPIFGYVVAGYTTLVSYMVLSVLHYRVVRKIQKEIPEAKGMFDVKLISVISVIGIVSCIIVSILYKFVLIRFGVLFALCVVIIPFRKQLEGLYKSLKGE
jgi:O-antigen/teichoic acid export membrane protein